MGSSDQRRYKRVSLDLPVRLVINATDEYQGRLVNMSPGDLALIADTKAVVGDAVVAYIDNLDVIEGTVARTFPDGIAVSFRLSKKRRAVLTEKLVLLTNPNFSEGLADRRSTPRHRASGARTACRLDDGTSLFVKIIDVSVNGVSVDATRRPAIGSAITIGRDHGIVARHTPRGFIVVYNNAQAEQKPALRAV